MDSLTEEINTLIETLKSQRKKDIARWRKGDTKGRYYERDSGRKCNFCGRKTIYRTDYLTMKTQRICQHCGAGLQIIDKITYYAGGLRT